MAFKSIALLIKIDQKRTIRSIIKENARPNQDARLRPF